MRILTAAMTDVNISWPSIPSARTPIPVRSCWANSATESLESKHRSAYEAWLKSQLPSFDILAVTEETAAAYAALRVALKRSGRPIPASDAWIAALALQHRLSVLSRDERFDVVPGLEREGW